jgi:2-methylisocitrate lyase-like PEP mutase family enzyme
VRKVSLIGVPGMPSGSALEQLGVARVSYGPWSHRLAMTSLADAGADMLAGAALPGWVRNPVDG